MKDTVRDSSDASSGPPSALEFNGLLYERSLTPANHIPEDAIARVVPYVRYHQDGEEQGDDVPTYGGGPDIVVLNGFVYARSYMDPALVGGDLLKATACNALERLQQMQASTPGYANAPLESQTSVQVAPQQHNYDVAPQQPSDPVQVAPQPTTFSNDQSARVMAPRRRVKQAPALQPLFDLRPEDRAGVVYIAPSVNNVAEKGRSRWTDEHDEYLLELMELAMLQLNRPLQHNDFMAITEAFHRHFRANGELIAERGWNTIHSAATRKPAYHRLVQRIFPELNFPDYVAKPRTR